MYPYRNVFCIKSCTTNTALGNCLEEPSSVVRTEDTHIRSRAAGWLEDTSHLLSLLSARPSPNRHICGWSRYAARSPPAPPETCSKDSVPSSAGLVSNPCHSNRSSIALFQPPPLLPAQEESSLMATTSSLTKVTTEGKIFASVLSLHPSSTKQSSAGNARGHLLDKKWQFQTFSKILLQAASWQHCSALALRPLLEALCVKGNSVK